MLFSHGLFKPTYIIPTGLIVPYTGGVGGAPSGWSLYSTANNYHIVGAGDTYAVNDNGAGSGNFSATLSTIADHLGTNPISTTVVNQGNKYRNVGYGGAHGHTATISYIPPRIGCYLIKAGADQTDFPTNSVVWTYGRDKSSINNVFNIWTGGYMFYALAGNWSAGTNTYNSNVTDSQGNHNHGISDSGDSSGYDASVSSGGHTHTIDITMTNYLRQQAMAAWRNATSTVSLNKYGSNIIGMYESTTPPTGWYLCDGSNGTPDMRNYFVKNTTQASAGSGSGDGTVTAGTAGTTTHGTHRHKDSNESGFGDKSCYHLDYVTMAAHAQLSDNQVWLPPYYALAFIMKG